MGKVVVVTSGKGGVGKTTSTAALGAALAQTGLKVVLIDFDVGLRNLDLVMGAERRVVFDLVNVTQGTAEAVGGSRRDKRLDLLFLLPASQTRDKDALTEEGVADVIEKAAGKVRLRAVRQSCRHRARRAAGHALCLRCGHRHQPGSQLGARFRPDHRFARFPHLAGRAWREREQAHTGDALRCGTCGARRDAQH